MIVPDTKLVIFEGISGSGKSTMIDLLCCEYSGLSVANSRASIYEFTEDARFNLKRGGCPLIPELLLHSFTNYMKLFECYDNKDFLIVDRFVVSNLVYFLATSEKKGLGVDLDCARSYFLKPLGFEPLKDSLTVFFNCDAEVARGRVEKRGGRCGFDVGLQSRVNELYLRELECAGYDFRVVDSSQDRFKIFSDLDVIMSEYLRR